MRRSALPKISAEYARQCLEYNPDTGELRWKYRADQRAQWNGKYAGTIAGSLYESNGYIAITLDYRRYLAHRLAWLIHYGTWPAAEIDHCDRDRTNNRIRNLRDAGQSRNGANQTKRSNNTSGFKGVTFNKRRGLWRAQIKVNYRGIVLGHFGDKVEAAKVYNDAARKHFGEYAVLNELPANDDTDLEISA